MTEIKKKRRIAELKFRTSLRAIMESQIGKIQKNAPSGKNFRADAFALATAYYRLTT